MEAEGEKEESEQDRVDKQRELTLGVSDLDGCTDQRIQRLTAWLRRTYLPFVPTGPRLN